VQLKLQLTIFTLTMLHVLHTVDNFSPEVQ